MLPLPHILRFEPHREDQASIRAQDTTSSILSKGRSSIHIHREFHNFIPISSIIHLAEEFSTTSAHRQHGGPKGLEARRLSLYTVLIPRLRSSSALLTHTQHPQYTLPLRPPSHHRPARSLRRRRTLTPRPPCLLPHHAVRIFRTERPPSRLCSNHEPHATCRGKRIHREHRRGNRSHERIGYGHCVRAHQGRTRRGAGVGCGESRLKKGPAKQQSMIKSTIEDAELADEREREGSQA